MDIFIYNRFRLSSSLDFLPPSLQYLRKNRLWLIGKPFPRCRETQKPRMNMDSNMKLSHLSFRNHCIFRSLNNFSSQGQFSFFFFFFFYVLIEERFLATEQFPFFFLFSGEEVSSIIIFSIANTWFRDTIGSNSNCIEYAINEI